MYQTKFDKVNYPNIFSNFNSGSEFLIKKFRSCKYINTCEICIEKFDEQCCFFNREFNGPLNCFLPYKCPVIDICSTITKEKKLQIDESLKFQIENAKKLVLNQDDFHLDRFIPHIEKNQKLLPLSIKEFNEIGINTINLTPKNVFSQGNVLRLLPSYNINLHEKIDFDHHIFFSWNTRDILCHKMMDNIETTINALRILQIDSSTFPDANFYFNEPPFIIKYLLTKCYAIGYKLMELKIPLVPFYYPILPNYSKYQFEFLENSRAKIIAIPWYETNRYRSDPKIKLDILRQLMQFKLKNDVEYIFLNQSPSLKLQKLADYFSSMTYRVFPKKNIPLRDEKSCQIKEIRKLRNYLLKSKKNENSLIQFMR